MENLTIIDHPLIQHKLTEMRKKTTSSNHFRTLLKEISLLLAYEITRNLPMETISIETPLERYDAPTLAGKKLALISIYGIGITRAKKICEEAKLDASKRVNSLTEDELTIIRDLIDKNYVVEGDLRRENAVSLKRLVDLGCYRGLRHRKGLPVRGQRTHTNARTRKGKARPVAGKKKA